MLGNAREPSGRRRLLVAGRADRGGLFRPGAEGYSAHAGFVRRVASSCRPDLVIAGLRAQIAAAAAHAAAALPADVNRATQGRVLVAGDFLATLAVEATIHHLDLAASTAVRSMRILSCAPSRTWRSSRRHWPRAGSS